MLRAYFQLGQAPAGFRTWWRRLKGSDEGLDNTSLMRIAGRFARRVKGWATSNTVPIVYSKPGERIEDLAEGYLPGDPSFEGVFLIVVGRAPGNVWDVQHTADGASGTSNARSRGRGSTITTSTSWTGSGVT